MFKRMLILILFVSLMVSCKTDTDTEQPPDTRDILEKLESILGLEVTEIETARGYDRAFRIEVTQPVDHMKPNGETFLQRVYLYHRDESLPMIMQTAGYSSSHRHFSELSGLITGNHMTMPHRYFPNATPEPLDWKYLTVWQAAADHHRIAKLFQTVYKGKWLNTGASKGGMCALFHRYYYPGDVDVTVALVAPVMLGYPDTRLRDFLEHGVLDAACCEKIKSFQRRVLERRDEFIPLIAEFRDTYGIPFSIGLDAALEYAVMEYWFSFLQYGPADCAAIPGEGATVEMMFDHLEAISSVIFYSDFTLESMQPFYYQAATELGYYTYIIDHFRDLLIAVPSGDNKLLCPPNVEMNYDSTNMHRIATWLRLNGKKTIYVYAGQDPYTAASIEPDPRTSALKIVQPGADHTVRIRDLEEKELLYGTLEQWLGVTVNRESRLEHENQRYRKRYRYLEASQGCTGW
ncbi:MAG: hypothetical protein GY765_03390 [bacterium]|nr:hypothetical protein [bacterium]